MSASCRFRVSRCANLLWSSAFLDPDALLADIRRRDAEDFAERPQDLIELCSDWREHQRIRTHREQVETNIATKLKPSTERKERAVAGAG